MRAADLKSANHDQQMTSYYVSFSDLMLLLCTFFVMLLGMSKIDIGSFEKVKTGFTGDTQGTLVELAQRLQKIASSKSGVSVRLADDGVRLDLESAALFDTGSARLKSPALEPLAPLLQLILDSKYIIDIEGHTDDRPFYREVEGEVESNWSLSGRRASAVAHYLLDFGYSSSRIRIIGYADTRPREKVTSAQSEAEAHERELEAARAQNRRVSLLVR